MLQFFALKKASFKPLHSRYLEAIDYQLFAVYTVEKWIGFYL